MAVHPPFDQIETLAFMLAAKYDMDYREQVHLEAALNNLYLDLGKPDMPSFVDVARKFVVDLLDNVVGE